MFTTFDCSAFGFGRGLARAQGMGAEAHSGGDEVN